MDEEDKLQLKQLFSSCTIYRFEALNKFLKLFWHPNSCVNSCVHYLAGVCSTITVALDMYRRMNALITNDKGWSDIEELSICCNCGVCTNS